MNANRRKKRRELRVRNSPGIYRLVGTGKFRSIRRIKHDGVSRKQQAVFDSLEDAKAFRREPQGTKIESGEASYGFEHLVQEWKSFHYLTVDPGTRQSYEKRLRHLVFLNRCEVEKIDDT